MLAEPQRQHAGAKVKVGRVAARVRLQQLRPRLVGIDRYALVQGAGGVAVRVVDGARRGGKGKAAAAVGGQGGGIRGRRGRLLRAGQLQLDPVVGLDAVREQEGRAGERDIPAAVAAVRGARRRRKAHLRDGRAGGIYGLVEREYDVAVAQVDAHGLQGGGAGIVGRRQRHARERCDAAAGQVDKRRVRHVEAHGGRRPAGRGVPLQGGKRIARRGDQDPVGTALGQPFRGAGRRGRYVGIPGQAHALRAVRVLERQALGHGPAGVDKLVEIKVDRARRGVQDWGRLQPRGLRIGAHEHDHRRRRCGRTWVSVQVGRRAGGHRQVRLRRRRRRRGGASGGGGKPRLLDVREAHGHLVRSVRGRRLNGRAGQGQRAAGQRNLHGRRTGRRTGRRNDVLVEPYGQHAGSHVQRGRAGRIKGGRPRIGHDCQCNAARSARAGGVPRQAVPGQVAHKAVAGDKDGAGPKAEQGGRVDRVGHGRRLVRIERDRDRAAV